MGVAVSGESATHNQSRKYRRTRKLAGYFFTCANYCRETERLPSVGLVAEHPSTRYSARGVIAIDTLVGHSGAKIEDAGWIWDHSDKRHMIAHDYVIANYVCTSGKHYPLEFRRFRKR